MDKKTITLNESGIEFILPFFNFCTYNYYLDNKSEYNFQKES